MLDPSRDAKKNDRLQKVRDELDAKEQRELTLHPKTNKRVFTKGRHSTTGDANIDLYLKAQRAIEKQDKATAERLAFLPDGRLLAMFATGEMTIWKKM